MNFTIELTIWKYFRQKNGTVEHIIRASQIKRGFYFSSSSFYYKIIKWVNLSSTLLSMLFHFFIIQIVLTCNLNLKIFFSGAIILFKLKKVVNFHQWCMYSFQMTLLTWITKSIKKGIFNFSKSQIIILNARLLFFNSLFEI